MGTGTTTTAPTTTTTTGTTTTGATENTTSSGCTDRFWCQWKPSWACRYWSYVRKYCPNKCDTCQNGETTTTAASDVCEDLWSSRKCRWNTWRCSWSGRVRRNCQQSCGEC